MSLRANARRCAALATLLLTTLTAGAQGGEPFTLVCHFPYKDVTDFNVAVDSARSTANGNPAVIAAGHIEWTVDKGDRRNEYMINRYSGQISVSIIDKRTGSVWAGPLIGKCSAAPARQF